MLNATNTFSKTLVRFVYTTKINNGIGRTMQKIMNRTKKKKSFFEEQPMLPQGTSFSKDLIAPKKGGSKRRVSVLNKLFMRHITDLMATSEMSSIYAGLGLEINRVEVTPDYKGLNVFWIARNSPNESDIADMLNVTGKKLRHELTQLRVIGTVPKIYFVRDKQYAEIVEVDNRLANADFGDDYEPQAVQRLKTQLMINTTLEPNLKERIRKFEESLSDEIPDDIPNMPQDVLGLNHKDIMDRIKVSVKKSCIKPMSADPDNTLIKTVNAQPVEFQSAKMEREAFKKFLMERQILKRKTRRTLSKQNPDLEYFEDEYLELKEEELEALKPMFVEEKDYIEEDVVDSELSNK